MYVIEDLSYSSPTVPELLMSKINFPRYWNRHRRLSLCTLWSGQMTEISVLQLKSERLGYWEGPHRDIEDLLPPSIVSEVMVLGQASDAYEEYLEDLDAWIDGELV